MPTRDHIRRWQAVKPPKTLMSSFLCEENADYFNGVGCTRGVSLHPDCPRCHRERVAALCTNFGGEQAFEIPEARVVREDLQLDSTTPYLLRARQGFVSTCGGTSVACGWIQHRTQCGQTREKAAENMHHYCFPANESFCHNVRRVDMPVFVLSFKYDNAYGHFMGEVRLSLSAAPFTNTY